MTALGGQVGGGVTMVVKNTHASATIPRGRVASLNGVAVPVLMGTLSQPTFVTPVTLFDNTKGVGVTVNSIAPGDVGIVITQGPVLVESTATINVDDALEIATTGGLEGSVAILSAGDAAGVAMSDAFVEDLTQNDFSSTARNFSWAVFDQALPTFVGA